MWSKRIRVISLACVCALLLGQLAAGGAYGYDGYDGYDETAETTLTLRDESTNHDSYVKGRGDGTFGPDDPVSRAEAAHMLCRLLEELPEERQQFSDVPSDAWYCNSLGALAAAGVVDWTGTNIYPEEALERGEFVSMVVRLFPEQEELRTVEFTDVAPTDPYYTEILRACAYGWVQGYADGTFRPEGTVTRAEAVTIINRALGRTPDKDAIAEFPVSPFSDVPASYWAYENILEATISHTRVWVIPEEKWDWIDDQWLEALVVRRPGGFYFEGAELYYIDPATGFPVTDTTCGGLYFGADGKYTSGDAEIDQYVKDALSGIIDDTMTQEQKLHAAYNYARDSFTYLRRNYYEMGDTSWAAKEAKTMFSTKRGNCYCYSAVFYFLARQLGYDAKLISGKVNNNNPVPHAWVEIAFDGTYYMYDPELEMSYRVKGNYSYNFYHMAYENVPWRYYR